MLYYPKITNKVNFVDKFMSKKVIKDYYIKRTPELMKNFSKELEVERDILKRIFSEPKVNKLFALMKLEFEKIIPEIQQDSMLYYLSLH